MGDFEVIAVNDGSVDGTLDILRRWARTLRMKLVSWHPARLLPSTLNAAMRLARGQFIARQDADDVSEPNRFERQLEFLLGRPDLGGCGAQIRLLQPGGLVQRPQMVLTDPDEMRDRLLDFTTMPHPTYFMRRKVYDTVGGYSPLPWHQHMEDVEWLTRAYAAFPMSNIEEGLVRYRCHQGQVCHEHHDTQMYHMQLLRSREKQRDGAKVTVILPLWNTNGWAKDAVESIKAQTWVDRLELIIVNDDSPCDELGTVVDALCGMVGQTVWLEMSRRSGIRSSWESAISVSRAPLIAWSGLGERLQESAIEEMAEFLKQRPEQKVVYGGDLKLHRGSFMYWREHHDQFNPFPRKVRA